MGYRSLDILREQPASRIYLQRRHWQEMLADVELRRDEEACGLVAGRDGASTAVFPLANTLHSRVRYQLDPIAQFDTFRKIDEKGWELLAIYHSHLQGLSKPSLSDITEATYPEVAYLIWSSSSDSWECRGYRIAAANAKLLPVILIEDS
jgi:proteasome lid subunit RPN8/RPN11